MYLREMGNVELLTREGEISIAKRIEAGKLEMNDALFTCPYTYQLILSYALKVEMGEKFLRDIVDLPTAMGIQEDVPDDIDEDLEASDDTTEVLAEAKGEEETITDEKSADASSEDSDKVEASSDSDADEDDDADDEEDESLSLAAM